MADLAKLVVRLELQSAQLLSELTKTNAKLSGFEKRVKGFGASVKGALSVFAGAVGLNKIIDASAEAAKNFAQLENAVINAGEAAGGRTARQFADVSEQLQNVTTFSDDAIQGVQQLLLRFQSIRSDRFDEATKSVLDLSTAMGTDAESAAKLLGRALSDPEKGITALAKAGVIFSDSQKKVIKDLADSGRLAEAQGLILDELGKKFGGAAEAARNNFGGALAGLKNDFDNLLEVNGGLPEATASLNELAKVLQDPGVRAGADALFSVIVRGAALAAEFIGKTIAGIAVLLGYGQDAAVNLDNEINNLSDSLDSLKKQNPFPDAFATEMIKKKTEELAKLTAQYEKLMGIGAGGITKPGQTSGATKPGNNAEVLPDIQVVDGLTESAEKAQKALESAGKALTESLLTPLEKYDAAVAEADKLLAANVITQETWMRALGAARGELNDTIDAVIKAAEHYESLDAAIEAARKQAIGDIDKDLKAYNDVTLDNISKQTEAANKKLSVFAEQAARNTQDILADGISTALHDGVADGAKGVLEAFGNMLEQMAIQAIAANIGEKIFGEDGGGGGWLSKLGGLFGMPGSGSGGDFLGGLGAIFGGSRDAGGSGMAGVPVAIGRGAQPELFVPDTAGEFYPKGTWGMGGGGAVTQNIYTSSPITQRSARQLELEASRRQRIATARLG